MRYIFIFLIFLTLLFSSQKENSLISEQSPYLLQHAHNPVDWIAWGEGAFRKAKKEKKLIFLSIGYSTCHWCHVMAKESFEDENIAKLLNKDYISIKVDKEQYPHIDEYYQRIFKVMKNRSGGWPLTIIMDADKHPLYAGTYMPSHDKYGWDGLTKLLPLLHREYHLHNKKFIDSAIKYEKLANNSQIKKVNKEILDKPLNGLLLKSQKKDFDYLYNGFFLSPKFPHSARLALLQELSELGEKDAEKIVNLSLISMANGGIYDQVEGGFFRYSTDAAWRIPHFEKMLYSNAEIITIYAKAYKKTRNPLFKEIVQNSLKMLKRHFFNDGLYFSASDADTKHHEGLYYLYSYEEINNCTKDKTLLEDLDVSRFGNFENGLNHIYLDALDDRDGFKRIKNCLLAYRTKREFPFIDKKKILSWNSMMVTALSSAGLFNEAEELILNINKKLFIKEEAYHFIIDDNIPIQKALLEDYAFFISSLLSQYQNNLNPKLLNQAYSLSKSAIKYFYKNNNWYSSNDDFKSRASLLDKYYSSPLSVMLLNLVNLSALKTDLSFYDIVKTTLEKNSNQINRATLARVALAIQNGPITIKGRANNLLKLKNSFERIGYPYLLLEGSEEGVFTACRLNSCFGVAKTADEILKKVNSYLSKY